MVSGISSDLINEKSILNIIEEIKRKINEDKYYICLREKNELFKRKYRFTKKSDYKPILLDLKKSEFNSVGYEDKPDLYGKGMMYIFIKKYELCNIHGEIEQVKLYIKIKIPDEGEKLPIVSFHICEF